MSEREDGHVIDAMHRGVITCAADSSALTVARVMVAHRIHCVVVNAVGDVPRLVTDVEIVDALYDKQLEIRTASQLSRRAPLLRPDDTLAFALARMHENRLTHAIVVGSPLRLLGVVSVLDIIEWTLLQTVAAAHASLP